MINWLIIIVVDQLFIIFYKYEDKTMFLTLFLAKVLYSSIPLYSTVESTKSFVPNPMH